MSKCFKRLCDFGTVTAPSPLQGRPPRRIPVIGLVGGVGSGKSFLAQGVAQAAVTHRPIVVIEADAAGHEVLEDADVRDDLRKLWGVGVFGADGRVNRRAVARLVFGTEESAIKARNALEQIVHPRIRKLILDRIEAVQKREANRPEAIILDAALLLETGWQNLCDAIVFVDVPDAVRKARVAGRNWTEDEWTKREASQWPLEKKRQAAGHSVVNVDGQSAIVQLTEIINQVSRSANF